MTNRDNRDLLKTFINQTWNEHNVDGIGEFLADNYLEHTPFGEFENLDEFRGFITMNLRAFPDFKVTIDNIIVDENFVACNYTTFGTHEEEYMGVDATGNKMEVEGCYLGRIENGKLVEGWNQFDVLSVLIGLEVVSPDMLGAMQEGGDRARLQ